MEKIEELMMRIRRNGRYSPYTIGDTTYVTDAYVIIGIASALATHIEATQTVDDGLLNASSVFDMPSNAFGVIRMSDLDKTLAKIDETVSKKVVCRHCQGSGEVTWRHSCGNTLYETKEACRECSGTGYTRVSRYSQCDYYVSVFGFATRHRNFMILSELMHISNVSEAKMICRKMDSDYAVVVFEVGVVKYAFIAYEPQHQTGSNWTRIKEDGLCISI